MKLNYETIISNVRHKTIISNAIELTRRTIEITNQNLPIDMIAIHIKEILEEIGKITGETVSDEIIKEIFSKFCLGK